MAHPLQQHDRIAAPREEAGRRGSIGDLAGLAVIARCEEGDGGTPAAAAPPAAPGLVLDCAHRLIATDYEAVRFLDWLSSCADDPMPDLLLSVLTRAARHLGDMWLEDECSFTEVTIGMHRLTMLLIALEPPHGDPQAIAQHGGRIFLAPAPDDQHGFGLGVVGFFLRRAGWDVSADLESDAEAIAARLGERDFVAAGFSVGHERAIAPVAALIREARRRSRNRDIKLVVGGPMIVGNPDLARDMGADLWAIDAADLVRQLEPFAAGCPV